jgi:hypothetical protein
MDATFLDALLGFALAYSATYVLYCWVRSERPARTRHPAHAQVNEPELGHRRDASTHPL